MLLRSRFCSLLSALLLAATLPAAGQRLQPGFDKNECRQLLRLSARTATSDTAYLRNIPAPEGCSPLYRSAVFGLDNRWELWSRGNSQAVISIRGTTEKAESWLNNFYAAMVPAAGTLQLSKTDSFSYVLADNPRATVHVGWLLSLAYLSKDILPRVDSCCAAGLRDLIITGHSQGGAISYLLTAYLRQLQQRGRLPADLRIKTYCSAAPKPGNLYFAYNYEAMTAGGWAFNVVNSADWVPETPVSVQTVSDINTTNPFANADPLIRSQSVPRRWALRYVYARLTRPSQRAQRRYEQYLGRLAARMVRKQLPEFRPPPYVHSDHYVRTGQTIVLLADEGYYRRYPESKTKIFTHHLHHPYLELLEKLP